MCGRFSLTASPDEVAELFQFENLEDFPPRYNIAPTQPILMATVDPAGIVSPLLVRWGLVPSWVKDPKDFTLLLNARSETAAEKPSFRSAMRHRRGLVPASGFYEWYRKGEEKQAYWVRPKDGGIVAFGGLWETWSSPDGSEIDSGCILTTESNPTMAKIHHRMPVVIRPEKFGDWLDCKTREPKDIKQLMLPIDDDYFEAIPVGNAVNKVANSGPEIQQRMVVEPAAAADATIPGRTDSGQMDLF